MNCMIMGQCSNLPACNYTVSSKSTQANAQSYRQKQSLIERPSTDLRALLGCSGHVNNAFQWEHARDMLKHFWQSLYFAASWPPNAHSSICALHSYPITTASYLTHKSHSPPQSLSHHSQVNLLQLSAVQVRPTPKPAIFTKWGKKNQKTDGQEFFWSLTHQDSRFTSK